MSTRSGFWPTLSGRSLTRSFNSTATSNETWAVRRLYLGELVCGFASFTITPQSACAFLNYNSNVLPPLPFFFPKNKVFGHSQTPSLQIQPRQKGKLLATQRQSPVTSNHFVARSSGARARPVDARVQRRSGAPRPPHARPRRHEGRAPRRGAGGCASAWRSPPPSYRTLFRSELRERERESSLAILCWVRSRARLSRREFCLSCLPARRKSFGSTRRHGTRLEPEVYAIWLAKKCFLAGGACSYFFISGIWRRGDMAVNFYTGLGLDCPAKPGGLLLWPWPLALRINIERQLS